MNRTAALLLNLLALATLARPAAADRPRHHSGPIGSYAGTNLCLNVLGGTTDGATVGLWTCEDGDNSRFHHRGGHILVEELCLVSRDGRGVTAGSCSDPAALTFTAGPDGSIRAGDRCLDASESHGRPGGQVTLRRCQGPGHPDQQWKTPRDFLGSEPEFVPPAPPPVGVAVESLVGPHLCLNVLGGVSPGALLGIWTCEGGENARFTGPDGHLHVGGLCVVTSDGRQLQVGRCDAPGAVSFAGGVGSVLRTPDGKCLDVESGVARPGTHVQLFPCHGQASQQWRSQPLGLTYDARPYGAPVPPPPHPAAPVVMPCTPEELHRIEGAVQHESFSKEKLATLQLAAGGKHFLVAQVGSLVDQFSFSQDKLAALQLLTPLILDRDQAFTLLGHFTFSSDKEAARKILAN